MTGEEIVAITITRMVIELIPTRDTIRKRLSGQGAEGQVHLSCHASRRCDLF